MLAWETSRRAWIPPGAPASVPVLDWQTLVRRKKNGTEAGAPGTGWRCGSNPLAGTVRFTDDPHVPPSINSVRKLFKELEHEHHR
jgi:hypothetical protein